MSDSLLNPYRELGGREAVIELVERFYDLMEAREPALAALHERGPDGKISRRNRDRFGLFLVGWLGGPDDYVQKNGHPRLRLRHARVPVDAAMRDAWLRCMFAALDERVVSADVSEFLRHRLAEVADFLRNVEDERVEEERA
ncbi:MAG TPA: group II truncated hemoglobin [Polyangiaceae bacterium]|nr:group II truncated hemoglobin [Polyangiaceae bacterium]